ncbi:C-C motif chemokine 22-like [Seriola aureovittata]|uniref:C-C motif chemokine 22-like n=1 Tax=Seriola aureovittata TaxID=2871759 RepID=UPI0024BD9DCF|nr:C-C motif chemokine 22-like [Seriola aureovittata]
MKTLLTLLFLTLICSLHHTSAGPVAVEMMVKGACCPGYNQTRIPKAKVKHVAMTPDGCTDKAVVVTTVCNKKFCIDPSWIWARNLLKEFKKSTAGSTSPRAPFNRSRC